MRIIFIFILSLLTLAGCVTHSLRPGAEDITFSEEAPKKECKKIENARYVAPPIGTVDKSSAEKNLSIRARNDALRINADYVHLKRPTEKPHFSEPVQIYVDFYACKAK